jgi:Putative zinc-finger
MRTSGGQLCARARFWASLRLDGEISELESALLDAHLARCADCAAYASGSTAATVALRAAPLELVTPLAIAAQQSGTSAFALVAAAMLGVAALLGALGDGTRSHGGSPVAGRTVAVVATVETPDQMRRLRRTSLLNTRPVPPEFRGEPA